MTPFEVLTLIFLFGVVKDFIAEKLAPTATKKDVSELKSNIDWKIDLIERKIESHSEALQKEKSNTKF